MGACLAKEAKPAKKDVEMKSEPAPAKAEKTKSAKPKAAETKEAGSGAAAPAAAEEAAKPKKEKKSKDESNKENAKPAEAPAAETDAASKKEAKKEKKEKKEEAAAEKKETTEKGSSPSSPASEERMTLEEATAETDALYKKYRAEVDEHAKLRAQYFEDSKKAFDDGDKAKAKELSDKGKEEGRLMEEASMRAARAIFDGKNQKQPEGTIDLHGQHVKEAEVIVKEQLEGAKKKGLAELNIIIGAGHHSGKEGPKVGPAVKKMLDDMGIKWRQDETNASGGAIIATL